MIPLLNVFIKTTNMTPPKRTPHVFIIGNPRSGTTLLRLMLTCHSAVVVPPECGFVVWLHQKYKTWSSKDCDSTTVRNQFLDDLLESRKFETWGLDRSVIEGDIVSSRPGDYAELCDVVYTAYGHLSGTTALVLGDKNNFHIDHLALLNDIFPDSLFLHIVRDGRDVACSYREVMKIPSVSPYAPRLETDIALIAEEWSQNLRKVRAFFTNIADERKAWVRYEDLVTQPGRSLQRICDWLGLEFEPEMLNFHEKNKSRQIEPKLTMDWKRRTMRPISDETVGRYHEMLSEIEREIFESVCVRELVEYGYKHGAL